MSGPLDTPMRHRQPTAPFPAGALEAVDRARVAAAAWGASSIRRRLRVIRRARGMIARDASALARADFVVALSPFRHASMNYADVLLPVAPFTESSGTYVNVDGRAQVSRAAVAPRGEARPGWKVLRVLGNQLGLDGFDFVDIDGVRAELALESRAAAPDFTRGGMLPAPGDGDSGAVREEFHRIFDVPLYRIDPYTRRANALQHTHDNPRKPLAGLNPAQFDRFSLRDGAIMNLVTPDGDGVTIEVRADPRVPENCIYVPSGYRETAVLGLARRVALEEV